MRRNLRARIDKLERRTATGPRRSIWDVVLGTATVEDLDEADREALWQREAQKLDRLGHHPAMLALRAQWARLGIADPGQYSDIDMIEEAIRLAGIPTPSALPCGLKELPAIATTTPAAMPTGPSTAAPSPCSDACLPSAPHGRQGNEPAP
jgi:hypothetical protein